MRITEIVNPRWYVTSNDKHKLGSVIERQGTVCQLGAALEGRLEARRPATCLPRGATFYLATMPSNAGPYVYEVEPVGQIDRQHSSWLQRLNATVTGNVGERDQLATGYWSGLPIPEMRDAPWEHRALRVRVLKCVGGTEC